MHKSILQLSISSIFFMLSGYLINIWLGKELGPTNYGIYGIIISLMTAMNVIQVYGIPQATTKFISSKKFDSEKVLRSSIMLQLILTFFLSTLLYFSSVPISLFFNDLTLVSYIKSSSFILPFYSIFSIYSAYYSGLHNFKKQALINIVYSLSKLFFVISLVYIFHLYGAIAGFIISPLIALLFGFHFPRTKKIEVGLYKLIIIFSLPLVGYAILSTLQLSIDLFILKSLSNNLQSGFYTAEQNITRIPFYALSGFTSILFPIVTYSIHNESMLETMKKIKNILRNLYILLFPGTLLIALTSTPLLKILYTNEYIPAAPSLSLLVFGLGFLTVLNALTYVMVGADRPNTAMLVSGLGVIITAFVCYVSIPSLGLIGAALGTTVGAVITTLLSFYIISRQFPNITPWKSLRNISLGSLGIYLAYLLIGSYFTSLYLLPVLYIILSLVYGGILFILKEVTKKDIEALKELLPRSKEVPISING